MANQCEHTQGGISDWLTALENGEHVTDVAGARVAVIHHYGIEGATVRREQR
ncbi:hypothetical protein OG897_30350 [Streptomyces sp. NBC_00237]|uniref:hypothetical protein n=1 Tax=Streptomyces sp. NBC_00237 TaxID=2975687 RepID=UPI002256D117|nr:hypothetical protein [Streptomyces sp. NBC_00237]MCX5205741.1 hypothetical protein [Streptomyces sp. NBC_00237]